MVELKRSIFSEKYIGSYGNTCIITDNVFEALSYDDLYSAKEDACSFNGRVLEHKPNLEVVKQWGVIAIIILVLLLFGSILEQNDLKHQLEVKDYEIKTLKDKLENGG